jgi:hypothetical protein
MNDTFSKYINGCFMCATSKTRNRNLGLYTLLLVPSQPWENISVDFVWGLSMSRTGHDYLYVMVDRFNKMCILMPCRKQVTTEKTTHIFFANVWVHFGLPTSIIRGSHFLGNFLSHLWELMDTKLKNSTNFHPQIEGQTEVVNIIVVHLIRGYYSKHPKLWDEKFPYIHHGYSHAMHSSTQKNRFEVCFGYLPKSPMEFVFRESNQEYGQDDTNKSKRFI